MKMKLKKNDKVTILIGKDKNKTGEINRVLPDSRKVVVNGLNIVKKATKPSKKNPGGGIIEIAKPIDISNVAFICPSCGKPTRLGVNFSKNGERERFCKKCKTAVKEQ